MTCRKSTNRFCLAASLLLTICSANVFAKPLQYEDVFDLEFVSDPQPDSQGEQIVFVRNWMDKQTDRRRMTLWLSSADGKKLEPLTDKNLSASNPQWSPDNKQIAFIANGQNI